MTQGTSLPSVLQDVLRVYDHRFLELEPEQRRRLVLGTRQVLGDEGLPAEARAALPASYRLRAFCIQRELHEELERLIREEVAGRQAGAVVVGGRVYAMYPYLRGVPRRDADITDEVRAEHILDALVWTGGRLRVRGRAAISQIETRTYTVELALRQGDAEHRIPTTLDQGAFEALIDPAGLSAGPWDVHVVVHTHGLTREAPFGTVRDPKLKADPRERNGVSAHFTGQGTLAVRIPAEPSKRGFLHRIFRRHPFAKGPRAAPPAPGA